MSFRLRIDDCETGLEILARRPRLRIRMADAEWTVCAFSRQAAEFDIRVNGRRHRGYCCPMGSDAFHVWIGGRTFIVELPQRSTQARTVDGQTMDVYAQMPGIVLAVHCEEGQQVEKGAPLVTLESMKLQSTIVATCGTVIERVHVPAGTVVARGALLVSFRREVGST